MSPATRYALNGLMDNVAHKLGDSLASWFGAFGPYTVYTRVPFGQDDWLEYGYGAFTEKQALRLLAEFGTHGGSVHKWGKLVAMRG